MPRARRPSQASTAEARRSGRAQDRRPVTLVKALDDIPAAVATKARRDDLVITLGAGSIGTMPDRILEALKTIRPAEAGPSRAEAAAKAEVKADDRQGAGRKELPPREGASGRKKGSARRLRGWCRGGSRAGRSPASSSPMPAYRGTNLVAPGGGAAGAPDHGPRQRAPVERRGAGDRRRSARHRASSRRTCPATGAG